MKKLSISILLCQILFISNNLYAQTNLIKSEEFSTDSNKSTVPYKILFSNDTTNLNSALSPYHTEGGFTEQALKASIDETVNIGVDVHVLEPGYGWVPWWKSEIMPAKEHFEWFKKTYNVDKLDSIGQYLVDGGDIVGTFIDHCRKVEMIPFISYRLNDSHGKEYISNTSGTIGSHWATSINRFYYEHPQYRLGPSLTAKSCLWPLLNWAIPEVVEHKFALIEELCKTYDFEGLQLDFIRHPNYFRQNETTSSQRKKIMADFVLRVRKMLDANKFNGKRRWLCARVPCFTAVYDSLGIDLKEFSKAGVDMVVLSPFYFTQQHTDLKTIKEQIPDVAVYMELTQTSVLGEKIGPYYQVTRFNTDVDFYTSAHQAYSQGADGISLFNFVYYRPSMPWKDSYKTMVELNGGPLPTMEPPFELVKNLRENKWLSNQPQHYYLGRLWDTPYVPEEVKLLRKWIANGKTLNFEMQLSPPQNGWKNNGRIRMQTIDPCRSMEFSVKINGHELKKTDNISEPYPYPYPSFFGLGDETNIKAWTVPVKILKQGVNTIDITMIQGGMNQIFYIDLAIE